MHTARYRGALALVGWAFLAGCSEVQPLDLADGGSNAPVDMLADMPRADLAADAPLDLAADAPIDLAADAPLDLAADAPADLGDTVACTSSDQCVGWRPTDTRVGCGAVDCIRGACGIDPLMARSCAMGYECDYATGRCVLLMADPPRE